MPVPQQRLVSISRLLGSELSASKMQIPYGNDKQECKGQASMDTALAFSSASHTHNKRMTHPLRA
jgi:hypothetical protein